MKEEVAKILLSINAVTLNPSEPYRYASGILSPIYCDNRLLMSYPEQRQKIRDSFATLIEDLGLKFDVIAGTATAGIPHAAWLAEKLRKPMIYIRSKAKEHGKTNQVEGVLKEGQSVLVIEDLVSTGGSSVAAVDAVRQAGGDVIAVIAIFTYEMEKAKDKFVEAECPLFTLSNFSTLVNVAEQEGYVSEEQRNIILEWNKNPVDWGKSHGFE